MPQKVNKKQVRAANPGLPKKAINKKFRAEVKTANGGQSRFKRLAKGALSIGAGFIPGIGGQVAATLNDKLTKQPNDLPPTFVKDEMQATAPSMGDMAIKQAAETSVVPITQPTAAPKMTTEAAPINDKPNRPNPTANESMAEKTEKQTTGGGGGTGGYDEGADEDSPKRSGKSYMPAKDGEPTPPKKDNKMLYIIIGIVFFLVMIFIIAKSLKK